MEMSLAQLWFPYIVNLYRWSDKEKEDFQIVFFSSQLLRSWIGVLFDFFNNYRQVLGGHHFLCHQFASDGNISNMFTSNGPVNWYDWLKFYRHIGSIYCIFGKFLPLKNLFIGWVSAWCCSKVFIVWNVRFEWKNNLTYPISV